jgi:predicted amidohydrolase
MVVKIALANYPISRFSSLNQWEQHVKKEVHDAVSNGAKILVFPEYGSMELTSLFEDSMQKNLHLQIQEMQGLLDAFCSLFRNLAKECNVVIIAPSFPVSISGRTVNRAFVFGPRGEGYQDKWNMTRFEDEEWQIQSPEQRILTVFESEFGIFGIQICYDIEFPGASAVLAQSGCQLILVPSCTETIRGATRVHVGARARALEQQIYVGVSQTCGDALWSPAVDVNYGYTAMYASPDKLFPELGIVSIGNAQEISWFYTEVDFDLVEEIRKSGQVLNFRDYQKSETKLELLVVSVRV